MFEGCLNLLLLGTKIYLISNLITFVFIGIGVFARNCATFKSIWYEKSDNWKILKCSMRTSLLEAWDGFKSIFS